MEEEKVVRTLEFPKEHMQALEGLIFLGRLSDTVRAFGHTFEIQTLTVGEMARAGEIIRPFIGSRGEAVAYKLAIVAACTKLVDGKQIYTPISDGDDEVFGRFEVMKSWYPVVVDRIFDEYASLEVIVKEVSDALGE